MVYMTECSCGHVIAPTPDGQWVVVGDPENDDHEHGPEWDPFEMIGPVLAA